MEAAKLIINNAQCQLSNLDQKTFGHLRETILYFDHAKFRRIKKDWLCKTYLIDTDGKFLTGLLPFVINFFKDNYPFIKFSVDDRRVKPEHSINYISQLDEPTLYPDQSLALKTCEKDPKGILSMSTGCLTGDMIININRASLGKKKRLDILYKTANGEMNGKPGYNKYNFEIPTFIRSFREDEGLVRLNKALEFVKSGVKDVYKLTLNNGRFLRATSDHPVMTKTGFVMMRDLLSQSSYVMCDSLHAKKSGNKEKKMRDSYYRTKYHPHQRLVRSSNKAKRKKADFYRITAHRGVYEANLNNLSVEAFRYILINDMERSKSLQFSDPNMVIHHINNNHHDNDPRNLALITHKEHMAIHSHINRKNFNQGIPSYSKAISIEYDGEEMTYDIRCHAPYHNFVANGIVVHNSGKSRVIKELIVNKGVTALIVPPSLNLKQQTFNYLSSCFGKQVSIYNKKKDPTDIVVVNYHSMAKMPVEYVNHFDMVIYDEFHNFACSTAREVERTKMQNVYYKYALTATNFRNGDDDILLHSVLSKTLFHLDLIDAINKKYITPVQGIFYEMNNSDLEVTPKKNINGTWNKDNERYQADYETFIVKNVKRNKKAIDISKKMIDLKVPTLILVKKVSHGLEILKRIPNAKFANSTTQKSTINFDLIDDFNAGKIPVLIGTSVIGEGVDTKRCGAVINLSGGKAKSELLQKVGRVVRRFEGKEVGFYFDFIDKNCESLRKQSVARKNIIKNEYGIKPKIFLDS